MAIKDQQTGMSGSRENNAMMSSSVWTQGLSKGLFFGLPTEDTLNGVASHLNLESNAT